MLNTETMTIKDLAVAYNAAAETLGQNTIKTFKDRPTAIRRVTKILAAAKDAAPKTTTKKTERKASGINFLGMRVDIKVSEVQAQLKRPNTTMQRLLPILKRGATFEDMEAVFKEVDTLRSRTSKRPVRIRMYEAVRHFCYVYGYGTESTATKITIVEA